MHVKGIYLLISLPLTVISYEVLEVLNRESVTLKITGRVDEEKLRAIEWSTNKTTIVEYMYVGKTVHVSTRYKSRVDFDVDTFSLRLRNLMKKDSGIYMAMKNVEGRPKETVAEYHISVLEAVDPSLTVVSNWSSSDSCSVTVNCSAGDASLISSSNSSCSLEGGRSLLSLSFNHNTVSCTHSNPVRWRQDTMELKPLCPLNKGNQNQESRAQCWVWLPIALVLSLIIHVDVWKRRE
ncbi:hypothetical protein AALO_G00008170 [Alosa alosa]|uniref:Immunoglobulin V-set domain-containing protein n=1 Tax=Alosa alosa TaxID=278164 RepID=A0AAV6HK53_9TELE|nr:hypothetical protein AALO_G00008170 [Alosa alosa]